jgi:dihydroxyacetone kinase
MLSYFPVSTRHAEMVLEATGFSETTEVFPLSMCHKVLWCVQDSQYLPIKRGGRVGLMINSLGATPLMELMIAAGEAIAQLQLDHGMAVERVYTGSFMTSLDMAGNPFPHITE